MGAVSCRRTITVRPGWLATWTTRCPPLASNLLRRRVDWPRHPTVPAPPRLRLGGACSSPGNRTSASSPSSHSAAKLGTIRRVELEFPRRGRPGPSGGAWARRAAGWSAASFAASELRKALADAYATAGRGVPGWTDASLAPASAPIRAAHLDGAGVTRALLFRPSAPGAVADAPSAPQAGHAVVQPTRLKGSLAG